MENSTLQKSLPNATAVLVLGIISIVFSCCYGIIGLILSIIALVLASKDLKLYNENVSIWLDSSVKNLKAGRVCAIVGLCLSTLTFIWIIVYFVIIGTALTTGFSSFPWADMFAN